MIVSKYEMCAPFRGLGGLKKQNHIYHHIGRPKFLKYIYSKIYISLTGSTKEKMLNTANKKLYEQLQIKAQEMRHSPTHAEAILWSAIDNKKLGVKFRRQHILNQFIVDFYCLEKNLVIEVDGEIHNDQKERDSERDSLLKTLDCQILRFKNQEVINDIDKITKEILLHISK